MAARPLIEIRDLTIGFGRHPETAPAVGGVSLRIAADERVGLVGESGSGKSTLARAVLGFVAPGGRRVSGSVHVAGEDVFAAAAAPGTTPACRVGLVPQNPLQSLTHHLRVGEQIAEVARAYGHSPAGARDAALDLMAQMDLPEPTRLAERYPHEISGGQRQRVVLAAALAMEPSVLVLDEPTTALDKTTEAQVLALIDRVAREKGLTLLFVSHDLATIQAMCGRTAVMLRGRLVETGETARIFSAPETAYARELVRAIPRLDGAPTAAGAVATGDTTAAPILRVEKVSFRYRLAGRERLALDGVTFAVPRGAAFGIIGESGSGKSTLAGLVSGLLAGHTGRIALEEQDLAGAARRRSAKLRRRIQMVFQDPASSLNPMQPVGAQILRPLRRHLGLSRREAAARLEALFADLDLAPELADRRPRELSGGQQQRVALARAFAAEPDLVICDEVTSALDVTVQEHVLALLRRLQRDRNVTLLFISHDLGVVREIAERVIVLERGQIREEGATAEVLATPRSAYAQRLVEAYRHRFAAGAPAPALVH